MNLKEKIDELLVLKEKVKQSYTRMNTLEKEIVEEMKESGFKSVSLSDEEKIVLTQVFEKEIDYDKMLRDYPDVYELGLKTTFSRTQALNSCSATLLNKIIKDCSKITSNYKIKVKKGKMIE